MVHVKSLEEFKQLIAEEKVFVDFFATWCGPCRMLSPVIEEIEEEKAFEGKILKVDVDEVPEIAQMYGIQMIPTLFLFKDGELIKKGQGYMPKDALLTFLNN